MEDEKNTASATADVAENAAKAKHIDVSVLSNAQDGSDKEEAAKPEVQAKQKDEPSGNSDAEK